MRGDLAALAGYTLMAALTLAAAGRLHRRGMSPGLTRKLVHVVAGLSPLYVTLVATHRWAGLLPYALTLGANGLLWRRGTARALGNMETPGIVYFPLAQLLLLGLLWWPGSAADRLPAALAGLLVLALGDAAAALVGQRFGRHPYHLLGSRRSWEGSGAMFLVSALVVGLVLQATGGGPRPLLAAGVALAATLAEALSPAGSDNLTVPLVVALLLVAAG